MNTNFKNVSDKSFLKWFRSVVIGCCFALLLTNFFMPKVFGVIYRDPASLWMFSGIMDILMGFLLLPVFVITHVICYMRLKVHFDVYAIVVGLVIHLTLVILTWYSLYGWESVLRAS